MMTGLPYRRCSDSNFDIILYDSGYRKGEIENYNDVNPIPWCYSCFQMRTYSGPNRRSLL